MGRSRVTTLTRNCNSRFRARSRRHLHRPHRCSGWRHRPLPRHLHRTQSTLRGRSQALSSDSSDVFHGYLRAPDGTITAPIDAPGAGTGPVQGTVPSNINPTRVIAGYCIDANNVNHGFVRARTAPSPLVRRPRRGHWPRSRHGNEYRR